LRGGERFAERDCVAGGGAVEFVDAVQRSRIRFGEGVENDGWVAAACGEDDAGVGL
jgi:hypothetical protein